MHCGGVMLIAQVLNMYMQPNCSSVNRNQEIRKRTKFLKF